jgi:hypothetical protein
MQWSGGVGLDLGPDGEIGRHSGLKIRRPEMVVGVQVPLRAPCHFGAGSLGASGSAEPSVRGSDAA